MTHPDLLHPFCLRMNTSDEYVYEQIYLQREYDIALPNPNTILDAGANVGLATILFASRFPAAQIIAVEPDPENFEVLCRNTSSYENVRCIQAGVWHRHSRLMRIPDESKPWAYRFQESDDTDGIESISLDEIEQQFTSGRIDLAKIDIEGAEREIFSHPGAWLNRVETVLVETHDRFVEGCQEAVESALPSNVFQQTNQGENHVFIRRDPEASFPDDT